MLQFECLIMLTQIGTGRILSKIRPQFGPTLRNFEAEIEKNNQSARMNPYMWLVDRRQRERQTGKTVSMLHASVKLSYATSVTFWNVSGKRRFLDHVYRVSSM